MSIIILKMKNTHWHLIYIQRVQSKDIHFCVQLLIHLDI